MTENRSGPLTDEQVAFEAWHMRTYHMPATPHYTGIGYGGESTDRWHVWQASARLGQQIERERAVKLCEKRVQDLVDTYTYTEPDTNATIWRDREAENGAIELEEIAAAIRAGNS